jgi:hypothetical protein
MSDGWDYQKKQQEIARNKQELTRAFPDLALPSPNLAYFRAGENCAAELCLVHEGKHIAIPLKAAHLAHMVAEGARLLAPVLQRIK